MGPRVVTYLRIALICLGIGLPVMAGPLLAGAWPRDPGRNFVSLSQEVPDLDRWRHGHVGLYLEQGLPGRLTVGLDLGKPTGASGRDWQALFFLKVPFGSRGAFRTAWSMGVGLTGQTGRKMGGARPVIRPGLHLGHGFDTPAGPGWLAIDASALYHTETRQTAWKMDATLGLRPRLGRLWYIQAQAARYPGNRPTLRLVPTHVRQLTKGLSIELGVIVNTRTPRRPGLRIGTWIEF